MGLEVITPHNVRHTFASLMIAAGANAKTLTTLMGHASITTTLDIYGHLFPGALHEAAALADEFLTAATSLPSLDSNLDAPARKRHG